MLDRVTGFIDKYWAVLHTLAAPWGIGMATWLLGGRPSISWDFWNIFIPLSGMIDVGFVVYGMTMSLVEGVIRVALWAIAEHTKKIRKAKDEGKRQGIDLVIDKMAELPDASPEELKEAVNASLRETVSR